MRLITSNRITSALFGLALALPVAAWAENPPAATDAATTVQTEAARHEKVEQRIADLHATLHITPAQETLWGTFAQVMLDNAQAMQDTHAANAAQADTRTAQEILQAYSATAMQHAQNIEKLSAAFGPLYTALTPEQKTAADDMFRTKAEKHAAK
jgi:hypothetical protein